MIGLESSKYEMEMRVREIRERDRFLEGCRFERVWRDFSMLIPFLNETTCERDERVSIFRSREMRKGREREGYV